MCKIQLTFYGARIQASSMLGSYQGLLGAARIGGDEVKYQGQRSYVKVKWRSYRIGHELVAPLTYKSGTRAV